jgi:Collagen triple helix repeat (20 copies)
MRVLRGGEDSTPHAWNPGDTQPLPVSVDQPAALTSPTTNLRRQMLWVMVAAVVLALAATGLAIGALIVAGQTGPQGPPGPQGVAGVQGPQGVQGSPGAQGAAGAIGLTGAAGPAGPRGATGQTGKQGPPGPAGPAGARGTQGPAGQIGTVVASTPVSGPAVLSVIDPPAGTALTASASCPVGQILLGGGAQITGSAAVEKNVVLRSSYPMSSNVWRTVAVVMAPLGISDQVSLHPYVLCGKAS